MQTDDHKILKQQLLDKQISLKDVFAKLAEMEEKDFYGNTSEINLDFLLDTEIVALIDGRNSEDQLSYYDFLCLTEFHVGQKIVQESNEVAIIHFKNALSWKERCSDGNCDWSKYITGTISYLEGNKIDEYLIEELSDSNKANILRNFNFGLKTRGYPVYTEDYIRA